MLIAEYNLGSHFAIMKTKHRANDDRPDKCKIPGSWRALSKC